MQYGVADDHGKVGRPEVAEHWRWTIPQTFPPMILGEAEAVSAPLELHLRTVFYGVYAGDRSVTDRSVEVLDREIPALGALCRQMADAIPPGKADDMNYEIQGLIYEILDVLPQVQSTEPEVAAESSTAATLREPNSLGTGASGSGATAGSAEVGQFVAASPTERAPGRRAVLRSGLGRSSNTAL